MWPQQVLPPRVLPRVEASPILLCVWCKLNPSVRAHRVAWQALGRVYLHVQPLLWQRVEEKRRPGSAQPTVGTKQLCHHGWDSCPPRSFSHCTGRVKCREALYLSLMIFFLSGPQSSRQKDYLHVI